MIEIGEPTVVIDHSEPSSVSGGHAVLRWVLAPLGATAALGLAYFGTFSISGLLFVAEVENEPSARFLVTGAVGVVSSLLAWTWAGASIAPPQHRRLALVLFSVPAVLFALMIVLIVGVAIAVGATDKVGPGEVSLAVGCVLACGGILMLDRNTRQALASHHIRLIALVAGSIGILTKFLSRLL